MNRDDFEQIIQLGCAERYDLCLAMIAEERDIWIAVDANNEFLIIESDEENLETLPIWPSAEFAEEYCKLLDDKLVAKAISVPEFFKKWVSGLDSDGLELSVFPTSADDVSIVDAAHFKSDLQDEMSNF